MELFVPEATARLLERVQKEKEAYHSELCELIGVSMVRLGVSELSTVADTVDEDLGVELVESNAEHCVRCRRHTRVGGEYCKRCADAVFTKELRL